MFEPLYKRSFSGGFSMIVIALTLAYCTDSVVFARVAETLDARHAGVGVAIFNAFAAALGGFLGPIVVGAFVQRTGSFVASMVVMGAFLGFGGLMMAALGVWTCAQQRSVGRKDKIPAARDGSDAVTSRTGLMRSVVDKDSAAPAAAGVDNEDADRAAALDVELVTRCHQTGA